MKSLIQKIFSIGRNDKQEVITTLNADEIKPIFEAHGIDIDKIGFPHIGDRYNEYFDKYEITFKDVKLFPAKINGEISTIITGKYKAQNLTKYNYRGHIPNGCDGFLKSPKSYNFKIKEGKLNIKKRMVLM